MGMEFTRFKELVSNRAYNFYRYSSAINKFGELYNEEEILYFYPKNIFNEKDVELIFFFKNEVVVVTVDEDRNATFNHCKCKVTNKTLVLPPNEWNKHELSILFDNRDELVLKNLEDSNDDWNREYSQALIELYKVL